MKCINCGKETSNPKFCSSSCAASWNNHLHPKRNRQSKGRCKQCGVEQPRRQSQYCSSACKAQHCHENYIIEWKSGRRNGLNGAYGISQHIVKYLRNKYNNQCANCGWNSVNPFTGKIPQEVEHIDGDYTNNEEDNLTLLCPNCHSLTSTYKGANRGHGRKARAKYSKLL